MLGLKRTDFSRIQIGFLQHCFNIKVRFAAGILQDFNILCVLFVMMMRGKKVLADVTKGLHKR